MPRSKPNSPLIIVRPVDVSDLADLVRIESKGTAEPISLRQLRRWHDYTQCAHIARGRSLWTVMRIAVHDQHDDVIGYVALKGENFTADVRIVVDPAYRGEGIGTQLLQVAIDEARDRYQPKLLEWHIDERHASTLEFAKAFGFHPRPTSPIVPGWFDPFDAFVLQLDLEAKANGHA